MAATSRPPYRYASIESCTSSTTSSSHFSAPSPSSSDRKIPSKNLSTFKHLIANSSGHRGLSDPIADGASRALARTNSGDVKVRNGQNLGAMVKKFIEKRSKSKAGSRDGKALVVPPDLIAKDLKKTAAFTGKGSNLSTLHNKLFQKGGTQDCSAVKALTEVKSNTRTLAMVLRSERELLSQNKDYENQISELHLLLEMKNREAEKLKDLCLKQREEIKALKDAILFPDVINAPLQVLLEKQGSELKQANQIIPTLQKQVTSLTGQLQCLVEDLAEVKADKYALCFDGQVSTPRTPICGQDAAYSLEFSSADIATPGSPDDMFMKDLNPCLTPFSMTKKTEDIDEMMQYDSLNGDELPWDTTSNSAFITSGAKHIKGSTHCQLLPSLASGARRILVVSDEKKRSAGKPTSHH